MHLTSELGKKSAAGDRITRHRLDLSILREENKKRGYLKFGAQVNDESHRGMNYPEDVKRIPVREKG